MIDAVIYGMIPKAKTVRRLKFPPENRSRKPKTVPDAWLKKFSRAAASMPGVGICAPIR